MAHIVSNTKPPSGEYGDEWFNPIENVTYKLLPASGSNGSWHAFGNVGTTILSTTDNVTNVYLTSTTTFTNTISSSTVIGGIPGDIYWNWNSLLIDAPQSNTIVNFDASDVKNDLQVINANYGTNDSRTSIRASDVTPYNGANATYGSLYTPIAGAITGAPFLYIPTKQWSYSTYDFTIECWVRPMGGLAVYNGVFDQRGAGPSIVIFSSGAVECGDGGTNFNTTTGIVSDNNWTHIAFTRQAGTRTIWINGSSSISASTSARDITSPVATFIGKTNDAADRWLFGGHIADLRVVIGDALYTTTFSPPTAPLSRTANTKLLTLQYNGNFNNRNATVYDEGRYRANLVKLGNVTVGTFSPLPPNNLATAYIANVNGGSAYFDGSGDYIQDVSNVSNAAYTLSGDFTAEAWIYPKSLSGSQAIFTLGFENTNRLVAYIVNGQLTTNKFGNTSVYYTGANVAGNVWNHIAFSRTGSTLYGFANGIVSPTVTSTVYGTIGNGGFKLGADSGGTSQFYGYISGFRLAKQGLYTSTFTPNTAAAATTTPTIALNTNKAVLFNGTGDYLTSPATYSLPTSTTPFTMEAWVYFTAFTTVAIACTAFGGTGALPFVMGMGDISTPGAIPYFAFYDGSAWQQVLTASGAGSTLSINTWYHLAYVYTGSQALIFSNGVNIGTASRSTWQTTGQANFYLGRRWDNGGQFHSGYISNFRLVTGSALYTSTFTPPTRPLSAISGTQLLTCQNTLTADNSGLGNNLTATGSPTILTTNPQLAASNPGLDSANTNLLLNFTSGGIIDYTGKGNFETANVGFTRSIASKFNKAIGPFQRSGDSMIMVPHDRKYDFTEDTNPFTIDYWIYPTAFAGLNVNAYVMQKGALSGSTYPIWASRLTTTGNVIFQVGDSTSGSTESTLTGNVGLIGNAWNHVAHTRNIANVLTTWVNGNIALMTFQSITMASDGTRPLIIGNQTNGSGTGFDGYLENIRVTKGVCRYTAPFVPTAANISAGNITVITSYSYSTNSSVTTVTTGAPSPAPTGPSTGTYANGEIIFTSSGNWTAPAYVTSISMVGVGGGAGGGYAIGGGGGGGGLSWVNSYPVVAGRIYTVVVGGAGTGAPPSVPGSNGGAGGTSYFQSNINGTLSNVIIAFGGSNSYGGSYFANASFGASGGGSGGNSIVSGTPLMAAGGGGAGGYTGNGGPGGFVTPTTGPYFPSTPFPGTAGSGGGGGGGGGTVQTQQVTGAAGGGGTGIWGQGNSGFGGLSQPQTNQANVLGVSPPGVASTGGGGGGSGGALGNISLDNAISGSGGLYGGGGGARVSNYGGESAAPGAQGAVRLIWGTMPRLFPNTFTSNIYIT